MPEISFHQGSYRPHPRPLPTRLDASDFEADATPNELHPRPRSSTDMDDDGDRDLLAFHSQTHPTTTYEDIVNTRPYHAMSDVEMDEQPRRSGRQRKATQQYGNTKDVDGDEDGKSACTAS